VPIKRPAPEQTSAGRFLVFGLVIGS